MVTATLRAVVEGPPVRLVLLPADVTRMMVLDHHRPFRARLFIGRVAHGPVRTNDPPRTVASKDISPGIRRVGEDADHARMGQPTPAQLTRPCSPIGSTRKPSIYEGAYHSIGGAGRLEGGENVCDCCGHLLIRVDDGATVGIAHIADR